MAELAREAVLHAILAALMAEALLRLWRASLELRLRLRLFAAVVPCLLPPLLELLAPWRREAPFLEGWALLAGPRWSEVRVLGLGPAWLWLPVAGLAVLLLGLDLVPWLRDRGPGWPRLPCPPEVEEAVGRLAKGLGLPVPRVQVVDVPAAMLFCRGVRRPRVVVSGAALARLDAQELEGALAHELLHLKKGDVLLGWGLLALRVLQGFNPVVQVLARAVALDAEERADAGAARLTGRPAALASALVSMFKASGARSATSEVLLGAALARAQEAHIEARGRLLLAPPPTRDRALDAWRLGLGVASILAVLVLVA